VGGAEKRERGVRGKERGQGETTMARHHQTKRWKIAVQITPQPLMPEEEEVTEETEEGKKVDQVVAQQ